MLSFFILLWGVKVGWFVHCKSVDSFTHWLALMNNFLFRDIFRGFWGRKFKRKKVKLKKKNEKPNFQKPWKFAKCLNACIACFYLFLCSPSFEHSKTIGLGPPSLCCLCLPMLPHCMRVWMIYVRIMYGCTPKAKKSVSTYTGLVSNKFIPFWYIIYWILERWKGKQKATKLFFF